MEFPAKLANPQCAVQRRQFWGWGPSAAELLEMARRCASEQTTTDRRKAGGRAVAHRRPLWKRRAKFSTSAQAGSAEPQALPLHETYDRNGAGK